ncbi:MarR family winged helix-turn-helix transcriptional regulator [Agrobacterium sp. BA1120]|uniref:MarR family winged helix-turn-helix transcriptional regulator n=1 Tax=Agrobacterium sp. BA1120 TaxID=3228927 RepID=UPI000DDE2C34
MIVTADEILHSHGILLRRSQQVALQVFAQEAEYPGFSPTQYSALAVSYIEPGINQNALGEYIALDRSSVTKCVEGLESHGLIRREIDPKDKRARLLFITPDGEEMLKKLNAAARKAQKRFKDALGETEFVALVNGLHAFSQFFEKSAAKENP